jgi:alcohol dehydrogenase class IV
MVFEFATATRIVFGTGSLAKVLPDFPAWGRRVLLVTGTGPLLSDRLRHGMDSLALDSVLWPVEGEPSVESVLAGWRMAREARCDFVVGIGGGSALDTGKAISVLLTNPGDPLDYLEVVGKGKPLQNPAAPFAAIPTTAGTGSEVTRNAVLAVPENRVKVSLRSPLMLPRLAVVDPELTYSLPPALTASTGLDALAQLIEPYVGNGSNPMTDALCREGMKLAARSLVLAYRDGSNPGARQDMALAALFGGLALANARLGAVHGLAGPLGGMFPIPHGVACARLLPHVVRVNISALRKRSVAGEYLNRFTEVAVLLTGRQGAGDRDAVRWLQETCAALAIPPLRDYGISLSDFPEVIERARQSSSMKGNPLPLTDEELSEILNLESATP